MIRARLLPLIFPVLLAACAAGVAPVPVGPVVPSGPADTCGAGPYADMIGQEATALERVLILRQVRVIRPGMAITMDFRPERINFDVDGAGRVVRIWCG